MIKDIIIELAENEQITGSNIAQYINNAVQREVSGDTTDDKTAVKIGIELYEKYNLRKILKNPYF